MKLLGIDTSSDACTAGVDTGDRILFRHVVEPRAHTRLLLPMITDTLREASVDIQALTAIVLGNGPGSFIGMRIGASVAQGLAYAAGIPLVPVSSLAAIACEVLQTTGGSRVAVAQDARMGEVYLQVFERGPDGMPVSPEGIILHPVDAAPDIGPACSIAGAGWMRHPGLLSRCPDGTDDRTAIAYPHARYLLACGRSALDAAIAPDRLEPAYVRQTVATAPGS